jgi:hypothetical protein
MRFGLHVKANEWRFFSFFFVIFRHGPVGTVGPFRNLNRRDSALRRSLVSVEKAPDEISATGGHRLLSPRAQPREKSTGQFVFTNMKLYRTIMFANTFFRFAHLKKCIAWGLTFWNTLLKFM